MKFIDKNKFYVLFVILRISLAAIFILFIHNWSFDYNKPLFSTRDFIYYYENCKLLLGHSNKYCPHYSIGASLIGLPIYMIFREYLPFFWISSFIMFLFSSFTVFLVGKIAERWFNKSVGILSSFFWSIFPFLAFFSFVSGASLFQFGAQPYVRIKIFHLLIGFAGILPDSVSLFLDLVTVYYYTLILFNHENKENKRKLYMKGGLSQGLAMTMRITNIALLPVFLFSLFFLRERSKDKSNFMEKKRNFREAISQIGVVHYLTDVLKSIISYIRNLKGNIAKKLQSIDKETVIYFLLFIGCVLIGFLPELAVKTITFIWSTSFEIVCEQHLSVTRYSIEIRVTMPWGNVNTYSTANFLKGFFFHGFRLNYLFIFFLITPLITYNKSQHLSKLLPILIFFSFLFVFSFWSYYPLLNIKFLLPALPFCFISLSASLMELFDHVKHKALTSE